MSQVELLLPPASQATTPNQLASLAELPRNKKYALYETISDDCRENYFAVSCRPITKKAEDDMELLSDIIHWGEQFRFHFQSGIYTCARCHLGLYSSKDKWPGPCVWPSFRKPLEGLSISTTEVFPYNKYTVTVKEVYCSGCDLFVGHQFEDGVMKGDSHPEARWRH